MDDLFFKCTSKQIYKSQLEVIASIRDNNNTVIMKPRQIFGIDTAIVCYLIQEAIGSSWNSVVYCNSQDAVWTMAQKIEQIFKLSGVEFSTGCKQNQPEFTIGSGSVEIRCKTAWRGDRVDCCYFSEAAFIPNLDELGCSVAVSLKLGGKIVMASTKNPRVQNLFSDIFLPENNGAFLRWNKIILDWRDSEVVSGDLGWREKIMLKTGLSRADFENEYETSSQF